MSLLSQATTGKVIRPYYILVHGIPGIGKSMFGAGAPSPIFLCAEEGTSHLDVTRLELKTFPQFMEAIAELRNTEHKFKSVVIDTIDHLEPLIWNEVTKAKNKESIEDIGYAKGYIFALEYWKQFTDALEALRAQKKMNIILLAHTDVKTFNDPQLVEGYDRYQVKLHHKAAGLVIDRVEAVLFANYKTFLHKKDETSKVKGLGEGTRVIYTEHRPAFVAKNRYDLPFEIPLEWADFTRFAEGERSVEPDAILANIQTLLASLKNPEQKKKLEDFISKNKSNTKELLKTETRLKAIVSVA